MDENWVDKIIKFAQWSPDDSPSKIPGQSPDDLIRSIGQSIVPPDAAHDPPFHELAVHLAEIAEHTKALERQAEASEERAKIAREQAGLAKQQAEQAAKEAKSSERMALAAIIFSALTFLATLAGAIPGYIS